MIKIWYSVPLFLLAAAANAADELVWENRTAIPGPGRHHPIVFANETHGFYLTGSTKESGHTKDFYMYEEASDKWIDLSATTSAFPGQARSFGYGVVLNEADNTKAYLGFGASFGNEKLQDFWEFDMSTHVWTRLADFIGPGRRHPAMVPVQLPDGNWEIHVGLGDGDDGNYNDWYSYNVNTNKWTQLPDFPSTQRHHPFFFGLGSVAYAGLGHSDGLIERDWYRYDSTNGWIREPDFASYSADDTTRAEPVTTEARVAGTEFSIELAYNNTTLSLGFVLSGDGDDHRTMETGEFHAFSPSNSKDDESWWRVLAPHPGRSRWAPGSFVMRGTARAYFTSGYDRESRVLFNDLWTMDLSSLFTTTVESSVLATTMPAPESNTSSSSGSIALVVGNCVIIVGAALWTLT